MISCFTDGCDECGVGKRVLLYGCERPSHALTPKPWGHSIFLSFNSPGTMNVKQILILFALILFFGFSFNAHACLVPVYSDVTMENGCTEPKQEPIRQFCDTFKFLGPQSVSDSPHPFLSHTVDSYSATPLTTSLQNSFLLNQGGVHRLSGSSPPDVLSITTVLRI